MSFSTVSSCVCYCRDNWFRSTVAQNAADVALSIGVAIVGNLRVSRRFLDNEKPAGREERAQTIQRVEERGVLADRVPSVRP
jgi:hypothetical protein